MLHRIHLIADLLIGLLALFSLFHECTWFLGLDMAFHIVIAVLALGMIAMEKIFHRHKGTISH